MNVAHRCDRGGHVVGRSLWIDGIDGSPRLGPSIGRGRMRSNQALPRRGSPLTIEARPLHASTPLIRHAWPADSSPGEIYPSYVNVPTAGCWRLTLRWARHTDWIDLRYQA
jgi:hypothetical protein